jgi:hypothetical protein
MSLEQNLILHNETIGAVVYQMSGLIKTSTQQEKKWGDDLLGQLVVAV